MAENHELWPGARLLGVAEAAARYSEHLAAAEAATAGSGVKPGVVWNPRWWPVLTDTEQAGTIWFTTATAAARGQPAAALWMKDREDDPVLAHDGLAALMNTVAEGLETGALGLKGQAVVEVDANAAAALFRRNNPQAAGAAEGVRDAAQVRAKLLQTLSEGSPRAQGEAATLLMKRREREAVPDLLVLLDSANAVVRRLAARVLEAVPSRQAVPALLACLDDEDVSVRGYAAMALAAVGDGRAIAPLMRAITQSLPMEAAPFMRALGSMNAVEAIDLLAGFVAPSQPLPVRLSAAGSLAAMNHERLPSVLTPLLRDPSVQLRAIAVSGLGRPDYSDVVDALSAALEDEHLQVRIVAAGALGATGQAGAVAPLQRALAQLGAQPVGEKKSFQAALQQALRALDAAA
jgi:HEAT repeat protein